MKYLLVVTLLTLSVAFEGNAKKVCILREYKISPSDDVAKEIPLSEVPISVTQASIELTESSTDVTDLNSEPEENVASTTAESKIEETVAKVEPTFTDACVLEGITQFSDQNELLRRLCTHTGTVYANLHVVTVQNTTVKADLSLSALCTDGPKGLLTWISWQDFIEKIKPLLTVDELTQFVIRNSSIGVPLENVINPYSEILIEMLPIRYKLQNLKPSAWNNNTFISEIVLGDVSLDNPNATAEHVEGTIEYNFQVETNTTFLSSYPIDGLLVEIADTEVELRNFHIGSTNKYFYNSTYSVERLVSPFKKETVSLKGTWGLHEYDIEGTIVSFFGVNTDGSDIEESHSISARVITLGALNIKELVEIEDYTTTTEQPEVTKIEELPIAIPFRDGPVYPGFRKYFYVACVLFFGVFLIAMVDVARKLLKDRNSRAQGGRVYKKVNV